MSWGLQHGVLLIFAWHDIFTCSRGWIWSAASGEVFSFSHVLPGLRSLLYVVNENDGLSERGERRIWGWKWVIHAVRSQPAGVA